MKYLSSAGVKFFLIAAVALITGCRKSKDKQYTISGKLYVSSSNPVAVADYKLELYQSGSAGIPFPIHSGSSSATSLTNAAGSFEITYTPGKGTFLGLPTTNGSLLSIYGQKHIWKNVISLKDTTLGVVYLYKKVNSLIVQVISAGGITSLDTIDIKTVTENGLYSRTKTGITIQPGIATNIDTINNVISNEYDIRFRQYSLYLSVEKRMIPRIITGFPVMLPEGDETQKTILLYTY